MSTTLQRWLAGVWVLSASIAICQADDWPQWLGPQRDSVWRETGIVEQFPANGPAVKWRAPIAGGYAGPAVADGRVYVTDYATSGDRTPDPNSRNKLQGQERVWCFAAADGRVLWKHEYDCAYEISFPAGPRATPTVDGDRVYTLGAQGDLLCLNTADGSVVWSHNFQRDYQAVTPIWGYCGHPLVDGDKLFCVVGGAGSIAVAFDKHTGKELWRALTAKEQAYCPPTMIEAGGKRQLVIWHAEAINGLDPQTGQVYWSVPLDANYAMGIATPRQLGQYLFAGGIVNKSALLKLGGRPDLRGGRLAGGERQRHWASDGHAVSGRRLPVRRGRQRRAALRQAGDRRTVMDHVRRHHGEWPARAFGLCLSGQERRSLLPGERDRRPDHRPADAREIHRNQPRQDHRTDRSRLWPQCLVEPSRLCQPLPVCPQ